MRKLTTLCGILLALQLVFGGTAAAAPPEKIDVIIAFDRTPGSLEESLLRSFGGEIKYTYKIVPAIAVSIPEAAVQGLSRSPGVIGIEPNITFHAIGEYPWGVLQIDADVVHSSNVGSAIKVAVIDTGIDYTHPELAAAYDGGYDFVNSDTDPMDDNGHGTHVAGTIAAAINGQGVAGVAPGVKLYALKVLDASGSGDLFDVIAALDWACGNNARNIVVQITNNSYGSPVDDPFGLLQQAFDYSYHNDYGEEWNLLHVAAAGNSGTDDTTADNVGYPARYDSVIAVAATDQVNNRAYFSSTGPAVELAAPGVNVLSTYPNNRYAWMSGTSMASPHIAGTAALVMYAHPDWTNIQVRQQLQNTADDLGVAGRDNVYGYGLVDADQAAGVYNNNPPVGNAGGPYTGTEDIIVSFDGSGSHDPDGDSLTHLWNFGDGSTGTGVNPTHVYTSGGTYTITLVVNDGKVNSQPATTTASITEVNDPPVANAGPDRNVVVGEVVTLDGSGSYDADGAISSYDWTFGDGGTGSGITTTHAYSLPGTYIVVLTVTDNSGLTDTDEAIVTVNEATANVFHVASIEMSLKTKTVKRRVFISATAKVRVADANGLLVSGVTVTGHWSGLASDTDSGITNAKGVVSLTSDSIERTPGAFTFTVDNLVKSEWTYNPGANVETSDSISVS